MRALLIEAAEFRLLSLLLECPSTEWRSELAALRNDIQDPALIQAAAHAINESTEGLYHSIFGPGGPAPAREVSYVQSMQLGYLISELSAYYDAFGFQPGVTDPPDHIAVELRFLSFLKLKEAYASVCGELEKAAIAREACDRFIQQHLNMLGQPLSESLAASGIPYLQLAGQALVARSGPRPNLPFPIIEDNETECHA